MNPQSYKNKIICCLSFLSLLMVVGCSLDARNNIDSSGQPIILSYENEKTGDMADSLFDDEIAKKEGDDVTNNGMSNGQKIDGGKIASSQKQTENGNEEGCSVPTEQEMWRIDLAEQLNLLNDYCTSLDEMDVYCFFTDPHLFNGGGYGANAVIMNDWIGFLEEAYNLSCSDFIVCGGDLLNNSDSKLEACNKLSSFDRLMRTRFHDYHFLMGNHDTNYQGDTYVASNDSSSCTLSQQTINDLLFDGCESYYSFSTNITSYYCFDTGIDWDDGIYTTYKQEQIEWFANSLLIDDKPHKALFMHAALDYRFAFTSLTSKISEIIEAFNEKTCVEIDGNEYDYSASYGRIEYIQSGHFHNDISGYTCGGVPIIINRSFSSPDVATKPTFDFVVTDYSNSTIQCFRIGDGSNRSISTIC